MKIRMFHKYIEIEHLKEYTLNDTSVVVDGQNFFYHLYEKSRLQFIFGCESDKYALYLRNYLSMFKKANVKCYFIFKGGHLDINKRMGKTKDLAGKNLVIGAELNEIVIPIFTKDVYKQVLDEMDFNYTICEYEAKKECIALAQKLKCPIISHDNEFAICRVPYIISHTLNYDEKDNKLKCGIFSLDNFLQKNCLTEEKLAVFVALTNEHNFPLNHFLPFLKTLRIPLGLYKRNKGIITWLAKTTRDNAVKRISFYSDQKDHTKFLEGEKEALKFIQRQEDSGIPTEYLENVNTINFLENDPLWFEKGVASKYIAIPLINIARSGFVIGSWAIADNEADDALLFSIDIIKYAFNLLTNYEHQQLTFINSDKEAIPLSLTDAVEKPNYKAICSPFENGWNCLHKGLFEHFLDKSVNGFDFHALEELPEDVKMLMIALTYFSKKKSSSEKLTENIVYCVLLSYVGLGVVSEIDQNNNPNTEVNQEEIAPLFPVPSADLSLISSEDKLMAKTLLAEYFREVGVGEAKSIFNAKWIHPLVEFQHCLEYLNHLNRLCGSHYRPTEYSKTFNGTFVYKVLYVINTKHDEDGSKFMKETLNPAVSVLNFLRGLFSLYKKMMILQI